MIITAIKLKSATLKPDAYYCVEVLYVREVSKDGKIIGSENWRTVLSPDNAEDKTINPFNEGEIPLPRGLLKLIELYDEETIKKWREQAKKELGS